MADGYVGEKSDVVGSFNRLNRGEDYVLDELVA